MKVILITKLTIEMIKPIRFPVLFSLLYTTIELTPQNRNQLNYYAGYNCEYEVVDYGIIEKWHQQLSREFKNYFKNKHKQR